MRWKDIVIGKKLMISTMTLLMLMAGVGIWASLGIEDIVDDGMKVAGGNQLRGELLQREVDHLNWAQTLSKFVYDDHADQLTVQLDHTQCGFGKWYYGEDRRKAEAMLPQIKDALAGIEDPHKKLHESAASIKKVHNEGGLKEARTIYEKESLLHLEKVQSLLTKMRGIAKENILSEEQMLASAKKTRIILIGVIVIAIIIGIVMSFCIGRSITRPLREGVQLAEKVSGGDLSSEVLLDQNDEIGQLAKALNAMVLKLRNITGSVKNAAANVASGAGQLSSSATEMSQGSTEQASSIEAVSSSMEEMVSNIRQNADNAQQTDRIAMKSAEDAKEGGKAVSDTVLAMKEIADKISIIEEIAR
ncbi:MAG TPA: HAMP domain-containing protein, partial [Dissulfurispiraceae bacterium]|nr:HAMP domain-containing protein [Dissulfurispiraceae bacterium]